MIYYSKYFLLTHILIYTKINLENINEGVFIGGFNTKGL